MCPGGKKVPSFAAPADANRLAAQPVLQYSTLFLPFDLALYSA